MTNKNDYDSSEIPISNKKKRDMHVVLDLLKDVTELHNYGSGHVLNRLDFNQNSLDSLESECKWSYDMNPDMMKPGLNNFNLNIDQHKLDNLSDNDK